MVMPIPVPEGFADANEGFEPIPAGTYTVEVLDAEEGETSGEGKTPKGTPQMKFEFAVVDDPEWDGRKLWMNATFSPKAMGMTKAALRAMGATDEDFAEGGELNAETFIGAKCKAIVSIGTNPKLPPPNNKNNNIKRLLPLSDEESELPG